MIEKSIAVVAGGCFWHMQAYFDCLPGVLDTVVGYTGGSVVDPTYTQVCCGDTGHAEAIQIGFDPEQLSYSALLQAFFECHNPTTLNRQGPDRGTQYRSAIFYANPQQKQIAIDTITTLEASGQYPAKIVTLLEPLGVFYPAEVEHQQYYLRHPLQCGLPPAKGK